LGFLTNQGLKKMNNKVRVMTKAVKRMGQVYPPKATKFEVDQDGKKITIWSDGIECTSFKLGDEAEVDSYNLIYTGTITKITDKAVTIVQYPNSRQPRTHRLDLNTFCWRNYKFDAVRVAAENSEIMNYI
jgi:hypothetical protein